MMENDIIRNIKRDDISFVHNIELNFKFSDNTYLIHKACLYNNLDLLLYLISKNIDINTKGGRYDSTPLYFTLYNHSNELLYVLCELGADVTCINDTNMSLWEACIKFDNILGFIILLHYMPRNFDMTKIYSYALRKSKYRFLEVIKRLKSEERFQLNLKNVSRQIESDPKQRYKYFYKLYNAKTLFLLFLVLFFYAPNACICLVIYLTTQNDRQHMKDKLFVFISCFYTLYFILKFIDHDFRYIFIFIPYLFVYTKLIISVPKCKQKKFDDSKEIINRLLKCDKYTKDYFCYICWIEKDDETIHCHICRKCIDHYDHHCKFLGYCISKETKIYFLIYLYFTLLLLLFVRNLYISEGIMTHYKSITLFLILQVIGRFTV